ncbi:resolvase domain protein [Tolypothrix sp. NIES-4075]|nr:IS607 family transposase [Tolypothrix sp. NIES-4075]GAX39690.1 resolvase domain protein [Tolypothrix sp. NIES-4075]GAX39739.1 resolvase domain protein [Tolypothrix sp. NIES-4075]GAX40057.1 resolvase domain protein [Tolypothrix sp. NIES-4075]GAX44048.1 resolvase domain protein [Tolypothrix sp. NIES-4075]
MYKPHEFAKKLGVTVKTLQRWDTSGKLPAKRTVSNYRYYTDDDLRIAQGLQPLEAKKKVVVYCRVSSNNQKPELSNQIKAMEIFCTTKGLSIDECIKEIGGGLNFKRKKFLSIVFSIIKGEIKTLVVAHKDRLCRFAFDFVEELATSYGCEIIVANQESLSPQQELVEDLMAIIHCFSCRLYGLRSYSIDLKNKLQETIDNPRHEQIELEGEERAC